MARSVLPRSPLRYHPKRPFRGQFKDRTRLNPEDPDQAIAAGRQLCEELLEPLQAAFGRLAIRSAYRAPAVNALGNRLRLGCASNERNYGRHIWDRRDSEGCIGAMASVVVA